MLFLIVSAIVLCSLLGLIVHYVGLEPMQALIALAGMTIIWHLLHHRSGMSISDDFKAW